MKRFAMTLALVAASGGAQAAFRDHEPFARGVSQKSVNELAGCMALRAGNIRGVETRNVKTATGITIELKMRAVGLAVTNTVFDIIDHGDDREILGWTIRRPKLPRQPLAEPFASCL